VELDFCLKLPEKVKKLARRLILKGEDNHLEYSFIIRRDFSTSEVFEGQPNIVQMPPDVFINCLASFHNHHSVDGILVDESFSLADILGDVEQGCIYSCVGFVRDGKPYLRCLRAPEDPETFRKFVEEKREITRRFSRTFFELEELAEESGIDYAWEMSSEELLRWAVENKPREAERIIRKLKNFLRKDRLVEERYAQVCEIPL